MSERGVYRLAGAMLLQAIQDASSSSSGRRSSALRWIRSSDDSCFSFSFVCRILNRNPEEVRRYCEQKAAERGKITVPYLEGWQDRTSWPSFHLTFR
ncbi:MAG TPA: hypothetical protein VFA54_08060 [Bryobacterales bacterium]|nr:hypothetical protein [Bryobacterales bacterium]